MALILLRPFRSKTLYSSSLSWFRISHPSQCHTDVGRCFTAPWLSHSRIYLPRTRVYDLQLNSFRSSYSTACQKISGSLGVLHEPVQKLHTSARLQAPPPLLLLLIKPLQKLTAIIIGRSIRKWWKALPPNKKQLFREWTWQRRWHLTGAGTGLLLLITLFVLTHLEECPVTGRTRLLVVNRENFLELSKYASDECMEEYGKSIIPVSDPRQKVVEWIVNTMIQRNQDVDGVKSVPWTVHVVENPGVNAFVLPNGKIFVFTGMLEAVADIHQLSFVLGHEMSHALIGHTAEQASLSHVVDLLSMIFLTMIWAICPRDSLALLGQWIQGKLVQLMFDRPFSRKLEAEADEVGLQLAAKACADVRASSVFWMQMELAEQLSGELTIPEWLSTHPSHLNRSNHLDRLIPEALKLREECGCPSLSVTDPRSIFKKSVQHLLEKKGSEVQHGIEEIQRAPVSQQRTNHQLGGVLATSALPKALLNYKDLAETTVSLK